MERINILIAEDDASTQALYRHILIDEIFEVSIAENGREALTMYQALKPDIIVLDIMLPVMTGYSVLEKIRTHYADTRTPIIMATSISRKASVLDCIDLGVQGYIVKPLNLQDVLERILSCCETVYPDKTRAARDALAARPA
jgi:CheY-like chemotaxis protein